VLNGAYLVDNDGVIEFHALTQQLAEKHPDARLDLQGRGRPTRSPRWKARDGGTSRDPAARVATRAVLLSG
jgi:hypothetical protein